MVPAFWLTIVGSTVLAVDVWVRLPAVVVAAAAVAGVAGTGTVLGVAFKDARRGGDSVPRGLWKGLRAALRWVWEFAP